MNTQEVIKEIENCTNAPGYVLVSLHRETGEAVWGEVAAMNDDDMVAEMESIGYDTEGMMTGEEFLRRYA